MFVIGQDVDIIEEGGKHTLILYNCKLSMTGEVAYTAANATCSANLKVKGEPASTLPHLFSVLEDIIVWEDSFIITYGKCVYIYTYIY